MIRVENLVKRYGDFTAVDNISFEEGQGEIFAFFSGRMAPARPRRSKSSLRCSLRRRAVSLWMGSTPPPRPTKCAAVSMWP